MVKREMVRTFGTVSHEERQTSNVSWMLKAYAGFHELDTRLCTLGIELTTQEFQRAYTHFIKRATQEAPLTNDDLIYIAEISKETPVAV